jgi:3-oxoadipate enol-lactonase
MSEDRAQIDVDDSGRGDAIVLLHGFPLSHKIWAVQVDALSKTHRVISPDLRGMGESSAPDGPYLMESLAADIAGVLDALSVQTATIVGHSLGGYVALAFARMYVERVNALGLVCSRLRADTALEARGREALAERIERENSIEPAIELYFPRLFAPQTRRHDPALVERTRALARRNSLIGAAAMVRGMAMRAPADDITGDFGFPVLVVAGEHDEFISAAEAASVAGSFPNARLEVCTASGHVPMLEEPGRLGALLAEFVAKR